MASGGSNGASPALAQPPPYSVALQQGMAALQKAVTSIEHTHRQQLEQLQVQKGLLEKNFQERVMAQDLEHKQKRQELLRQEQLLQAEREDVEEEKMELQQARVHSDEIADHQNPITLEIGGEKFRTQVGTLAKHPDSLFPRLLKTLKERSPGKSNGTIFIDRDSKHFRFILNFMRQGEEVMRGTVMNSRNVDEYVLNEIIAEVRYYKLPELERLVERQRVAMKQPKYPDITALVRQGYLTTNVPPQLQRREQPFKYVTMKTDTYFKNENFSGIVFERVLFRKVSFEGCVLKKATFKECSFQEWANFKHADLYEARFEHCQGTENIYRAESARIVFIPPLTST